MFLFAYFVLKRLGNKQDCEGALNENELHRQLELDSLTDRYKCTCKVVCVLVKRKMSYKRKHQKRTIREISSVVT